MTNEKMREEFEEWAVKSQGYLKSTLTRCPTSGRYHNRYANRMWTAWQASRENIEVEFPPANYTSTHRAITNIAIGYNEALADVKQLLTEQGFNVK
uniref:Uncharacterized protein n=2 Tax=Arsenophonus nasoniae TaxID=638 RepID=D2U0Z5_9GAMM|nr:hypothetical protein ARN_21880 [Arsenophonus nasoniae]